MTPLSSQVPWWAVWLMAYTVVLAFIAAIFVFRDPDSSKTLLIALITTVAAATGFYWGSSNGSEKKDSTIANRAVPTTSEPSDAAKALDAKVPA